jgi:hypothetical protein
MGQGVFKKALGLFINIALLTQLGLSQYFLDRRFPSRIFSKLLKIITELIFLLRF